MAPKRKNDSDEPTARDRKKAKLATARTIDVQTAAESSSGQNAVAGPSRIITVDSMKSLPNSIDVEKFAEARAFEISAMEKAVKLASESGTQRAWQALPRTLRRRAASHDVRRVPVRLREKARAEMDPPRMKSSGHSKPKLGKGKQITRAESFLKRQRDKKWLETHIWHAKRMKMENLWGHRLALHPTEKSFRPSHRAAVHGSILHDASYYLMIELKAPERILKTLLESCCDPQGPAPGAKRFLTGARVLETHIYKHFSYPFDLIAPITVMWNPQSPPDDTPPVEAPNKDQTTATDEGMANGSKPKKKKKGKDKGKGKGKAKEAEQARIAEVETELLPPDMKLPRAVWIRTHPAAFDDVLTTLQTAASFALKTVKRGLKLQEDKTFEVEIVDLRGQLNVFEIMGPKSSQVIQGALVPIDDQREEFKKFWSSLANLQTTGSLPRDMIIGCKVQDPRLKFPPANAKINIEASKDAPLAVLPSTSLAQSDIWNSQERDSLKTPRYKKKDLDDRRSKLLTPGTNLQSLRQDDRIPILLIQRSLECPSTQSSSQGLHGWTLIMPAGWSMPFLSSLTYTGTRVGGLRERQMQSFESGVPHFPQDYLCTAAYALHSAARAEEERSRWERKPPAKRTNFEKLGTRSPWEPDWKVVLGLEKPVEGQNPQENCVTTQRQTLPTLNPASSDAKLEPWLLRGSELNKILARLSLMLGYGGGLRYEMGVLRMKQGNDPFSTSLKADALLNAALVMVKVIMCGRGAPDDLAVLYRAGDDEARKLWFDSQRSQSLVGDKVQGPDDSGVLNGPLLSDFIIGYVTTGNYSLCRGEGFCIAAIPLARLFELQEQAQRIQQSHMSRSANTKPPQLFIKVRNREHQTCWGACLEVLDA